MAKRLLLLAAGAIALTACTSEDVVEDVAASRRQIQFETVVNKPSRAVDLTMQNLNQFKVYAFYTMPHNPNKAHAVFNNVSVTDPDGKGTWRYTVDPRYWVDNATYYFYAYSCGSTEELSTDFGEFKLDIDDPTEGEGSDGMDITQRVLEIDDYICDSSHQHDLVFASNTGFKAPAGYNTAVSFSFNHVLSKLQASFTSKFSPEYELVIKNVSVRNIRNKGNYKFNSGWDAVTRNGGNPLVYLLEPKMEIIDDKEVNTNTIKVSNKKVGDNQMSVQTNTAYVLPFKYQADNEVNLYFEVDLMYGKDYVIQGKALTATFQPEWKDGFFYVYNIEISPENINMKQIEFTVTTIKDWDRLTPSSENLTIDK